MSRRSRRHGPVAPWRFALTVAGSAVTTGPQLAAATSSGEHLDAALGRSLIAATAMWVVLGAINRILSAATDGADPTTAAANDDGPDDAAVPTMLDDAARTGVA